MRVCETVDTLLYVRVLNILILLSFFEGDHLSHRGVISPRWVVRVEC
jgi:hypothetical protein